MSVKAMTWVWEHSATAGNERLVLLAIADNADDSGANAWPSIATLAGKTRLDARTVQRVVRRLETGGHLAVTRAAGRGGANVYALVTTPPTEPAPPPPEPAPPPPPGDGPPEPPTPRQADGGGKTPPVSQPRHPTPGTAVTPHPRHSCATRTSLNVLEPPPPARATREPDPAPPAAPDGGGGEPDPTTTRRPAAGHPPPPGQEAAQHEHDADPLAGLGPPWRLTPRQRRRLAPLAAAALAAGWPPAALRDHLGANADGVRSPYAVLRTRLADLPPAPGAPGPAAKPRPPWCGHCDQATRIADLDDGRAARCPACHPTTAPAAGARPAGHGRHATGEPTPPPARPDPRPSPPGATP